MKRNVVFISSCGVTMNFYQNEKISRFAMIGGIFYFILFCFDSIRSIINEKIVFCFERWHIFSIITETSPFKSPKFAPYI